jgi:glycosyltransferase involved in cell wall biosynthesis
MAGDGPVEEYRRQVTAQGLGQRVTLPGWLGERETRELCARSDILVLPSHAEGLAMAVLEGLAHGLAVVTTCVGAHDEAITHGTTGLFVPVGDDVALAEVLARLVADVDERQRLSDRARVHYLARFSMAAYMRNLDGLYHSMIVRHRRENATGSQQA